MAKDKKEKGKAKVKKEKTMKIKSSGKGEKFADMSANSEIVSEPTAEELAAGVKPTEKKIKLKVRGKAYISSKNQVDKNKVYNLKDAIELLKKIAFGKVEQTVELHINAVSTAVTGEVSLPHFQGKAKIVAVFNDEIATEIKAGKINFDVLLATPADMPKIMPLAKVLGPKGLLPNPKNGTIATDIEKAKEKFSGNAIRFKTEKDFPLIHVAIGKLKQPNEELIANYEAMIKAVGPRNFKKVFIKSTMSPSVRVA